MKAFFSFLLLSLLSVGIHANNNTFYPVAIEVNGTEYVAFGSFLHVFSLPDLNLVKSQNYSQNIISFAPISFNNGTLYLGDGGNGSFQIDTTTFEISQLPDTAPPAGESGSGELSPFVDNEACVQDSANSSYCFQAGTPATITKSETNGANTTVSLGNFTSSRFIVVDETYGLLHLTAELIVGRGGYNANYFTFPLNGTFQIKNGPQELQHTALTGCPVPPRSCGVDILLYMDVSKGGLVYLWSISQSSTDTYEVHVETFSFDTGSTETFFDDESNTPVAPFEDTGATDSGTSSGSSTGTESSGAGVSSGTGTSATSPVVSETSS